MYAVWEKSYSSIRFLALVGKALCQSVSHCKPASNPLLPGVAERLPDSNAGAATSKTKELTSLLSSPSPPIKDSEIVQRVVSAICFAVGQKMNKFVLLAGK